MTTETVIESRVSRETFLRALETAEPGLSPREIIEQSGCFVLKGGEVIAYNDEMSVRGPSGLSGEFSGAVHARKLLDTLRRLSEDEIRVTQSESELVITGKKRQAGIRMEREIHLPFDGVERPGEFKPLPDEFGEAVQTVAQCAAGEDLGGRFYVTCVNIAPKWIEASDNMRVCRWAMKTGFKEPVLVKREVAQPVARMGVNTFANGKNWVHFKNARDFLLSVRKYEDVFPSDEIDPFLKGGGQSVSLPKGLKEACEKAQIFSSDNGDSNLVSVELKGQRVTLKGQGPCGWYKEVAKVDWSGPDVTFLIPPGVLSELVEKYNEVIVTDRVLKIEGGSYVYATCLVKGGEVV